MSKIDFERAALLFSVVQNQVNIGPQFTSIFGLAMEELKQINDEAVKEQQKAAKAAKDRNVVGGQPIDSGNPQPKQRIFPEGSGVKEEHDPPTIQRKA